MRVMRSGRGHRVNNGRHDLGAAQAKIRYRLRSARRITRFPARFHAGVSAACGGCFHHMLRAHFRLLTVTRGHQTDPERGVPGAVQLRRCAAISCRRRAILSSTDRPGYATVPEGPLRPCIVRRSGCYGIGRTDRHVSLACHSMCRPVPVSIGRNLKAGPRV